MISNTNVFTLVAILAVTLPMGVRANPNFAMKTTDGKIPPELLCTLGLLS